MDSIKGAQILAARLWGSDEVPAASEPVAPETAEGALPIWQWIQRPDGPAAEPAIIDAT